MSASAVQHLGAPSELLMFLEGRALIEFGAFLSFIPLLQFAAKGDGHPVLIEVSVTGFRNALLDLVRDFSDVHRRKINVVGRSLGGIYARELVLATFSCIGQFLTNVVASTTCADPHFGMDGDRLLIVASAVCAMLIIAEIAFALQPTWDCNEPGQGTIVSWC